MSKTTLMKKLNLLLADTYALYLKTQVYHWNVEGENFFALHEAFEKQYEALAEAVDEIAERIRTLGHKTTLSFASLDKTSGLKAASANANARKMVSDLHDDHVKVNRMLHEILADDDDAGTDDLLEDRIAYHEKQIWMLGSWLKK